MGRHAAAERYLRALHPNLQATGREVEREGVRRERD